MRYAKSTHDDLLRMGRFKGHATGRYHTEMESDWGTESTSSYRRLMLLTVY